jgi:hypothetical protein
MKKEETPYVLSEYFHFLAVIINASSTHFFPNILLKKEEIS